MEVPGDAGGVHLHVQHALGNNPAVPCPRHARILNSVLEVEQHPRLGAGIPLVEAQLYKAVTDYVRGEFNRAEALQNDKRAGTVGFALTILQRRLASSPEAIYQSLRRRKERLESRLRELELLQRGGSIPTAFVIDAPALDAEDVEDLEEAPDNEVEAAEEQILDQATAARTITELKAEIGTLQHLEGLALAVRRSGTDRKWRELANLLSEIFTPAAIVEGVSDNAEAFDAGGPRPNASPSQKLVIFTEHRDTLSYLE